MDGARWVIKGDLLDTLTKYSRRVYNLHNETLVKTTYSTIR